MKMFKLAVGFAAGYVLGTRAGREKFEQIAAATRKAGNHPTVMQAQEKAKALLATGQEKIAAKLPHDNSYATTRSTEPVTRATDPVTSPTKPLTSPTVSTGTTGTPTTPRVPQPARTSSSVGGDPL